MHRLIFEMELKPADELIYGNLQLIYPDQKKVDYLVTSGCAGWQQTNDQWARARGPIPSGFDYRIPTTPYWLDTKGIEGWFFHITPDPVVSSQSSVVRGEFGIHYDANVPGSAGCITLKNKLGWEWFCDRMKTIARSGVKQIPLQVMYS